ncbi:hypothetical protein C2E23DRAFT_857839 [Lenzites betulinus]|nr:hypothetical protein C2E23DRAFT_857839 [Lenzites betulinus]
MKGGCLGEHEIDAYTQLPNIPRTYIAFGGDEWPDYRTSVAFWDCCEPWLAARGYQLHPRQFPYEDAPWKYWDYPPLTAPSKYPFATRVYVELKKQKFFTPPARIGWAQDSLRRDVALKLVHKDTDDYRTYQVLLRSGEHLQSNEHTGVLLYAFRVLLRFYAQVMLITTTSGHRTLKGLSMLHALRIAHRDINTSNILIDSGCYHAGCSTFDYPLLTKEHRRARDVHYALFDFNAARLLPDSSLRDCHRPRREAMSVSSMYHPLDVLYGDPTYNPFAFDVASLGNIYVAWFQKIVSIERMLAPLFEKMIEHESSRRFTAEDALAFFTSLAPRWSDDLRTTPFSPEYEDV